MRLGLVSAVFFSLLLVAGCGDTDGGSEGATGNTAAESLLGPVSSGPDFAKPLPDNSIDVPDPQTGVFEICKVGTTADFEIEIVVNSFGSDPQTIMKTVTLGDGECEIVHTETAGAPADVVTITEVVPDGYKLDLVWVVNIDGDGVLTTYNMPGPTISGEIRTGKDGCVAVFYNSPLDFVPGRMTGGGNQVRVDGTKVTRGLTLHCDITLSNNLEINWPGANKWHITRPLLSAECIDDPDFNPFPPAAPFDTFIGEATGSLNGVEGSICRFKFIDNGEPGSTDQAYISIWAVGADPEVDVPVMVVGGVLDGGNLQAHYDQPHK
jgi:hypothetical protein